MIKIDWLRHSLQADHNNGDHILFHELSLGCAIRSTNYRREICSIVVVVSLKILKYMYMYLPQTPNCSEMARYDIGQSRLLMRWPSLDVG
jgi:hypothetical protein